MAFFSHRPQISNFPRVSVHFPLFRENYHFPPYFYKVPPVLEKCTCFYIFYVYFVSPTLTMMHLCITQCTYWTPLVRRKKFRFFKPFAEKFLDFHPQKFLMTFFLVIAHKFRIFPPIFTVSIHFPPVSRKLFFPPYFDKFSLPVLDKFTCFLHTLRVFRFPS